MKGYIQFSNVPVVFSARRFKNRTGRRVTGDDLWRVFVPANGDMKFRMSDAYVVNVVMLLLAYFLFYKF